MLSDEQTELYANKVKSVLEIIEGLSHVECVMVIEMCKEQIMLSMEKLR